MEINTLSIFIKLDESSLNDFLIRLIEFLRTFNISNENILKKIETFKNIKFEKLGRHGRPLRTNFYYCDFFELELEIMYGTEYYPKYSKDRERWVQVDLDFITSSLAKDPNNDDYLMSDFAYSEISKNKIKSIVRELFMKFPNSFVFFTNEYQTISMCEAEYSISKNNKPDLEFEFAILPKGTISNAFDANNYQMKINSKSIEYCSQAFL